MKNANLIRLRGLNSEGRWNDLPCNATTQHIICTASVDARFDVYLAACGVSFTLLIIFSMLLLTQRRYLGRSLRRLREIEKLEPQSNT